MSKNRWKDLTPREKSMLLVLEHASKPLTIAQLCEATGFKSPQPFRASCRFLEAEKAIISSTTAKRETVYAIHRNGSENK
jgi:hypothetical protein